MLERTLWGSTTIRIWFDELPAWKTIPDGMAELALDAPANPESRTRGAAVEYRAITGPRALYGALGATFTSDALDQLVVVCPTPIA